MLDNANLFLDRVWLPASQALPPIEPLCQCIDAAATERVALAQEDAVRTVERLDASTRAQPAAFPLRQSSVFRFEERRVGRVRFNVHIH